MARFSGRLLEAIRAAKIIGIRAGRGAHRFIGLWVVVAEVRVFVRSWSVTAGGWYRTFLEEPEGVLDVGGRRIRVRAIRTRSERLKGAVDAAYTAKYHTPGARKYVRDLNRPASRHATIELVPRAVGSPDSFPREARK